MVTHQTEEDMARIKFREWVKIRKDTHLGSRLDVGLLDKVRRSSGNGDDEWLRLKEEKLKRQESWIILHSVFVYFKWNVLVWVTLTLHSTKKTSSSQLRPARARSALGVGSWLPSYKSLELRSGAARDQGSTNTTQTLSQYFVFEQRMTCCLRLSCPLPVIGQLELMWASSANHRSRQLRRRQLVCISRHIAQTTNVVYCNYLKYDISLMLQWNKMFKASSLCVSWGSPITMCQIVFK